MASHTLSFEQSVVELSTEGRVPVDASTSTEQTFPVLLSIFTEQLLSTAV